MQIKKYISIIIILLSSVYGCTELLSQSKKHITIRNTSVAKLFENNNSLNITITTNLDYLINDIGRNRTKHQSLLSYFDSDSVFHQLPIDIKTRGKFRREKNNCSFPPLKIYFFESNIGSTIFEDIDELKLVTHCRNRKQYEQNVIKEYLVYKLWELTSEYSFHVRLLNIKYVDIANPNNYEKHIGFFIEDKSSLEQMHNGVFVDAMNVHQDKTNRFEMTKFVLFQFMIGNTDWSVPNQHNALLFKKSFKQPPIAIPYDFDFCGLVNAPYAKPQPKLGIKLVTDRMYRGFPRSSGELQMSINIFNILKKDYWSLIDNTPFLDNNSKKEMKDYIEEFYVIINNEKYINRNIKRHERSYPKDFKTSI